MDVFIALVAALTFAIVMLLAVRLSQRGRRRRRRRDRAVRHAAQLRLWDRLFTRHNRRLLTDKRDVRNG